MKQKKKEKKKISQNTKRRRHDKDQHDLSHVTRKPVVGVCDKIRHKPACTATEAR